MLYVFNMSVMHKLSFFETVYVLRIVSYVSSNVFLCQGYSKDGSGRAWHFTQTDLNRLVRCLKRWQEKTSLQVMKKGDKKTGKKADKWRQNSKLLEERWEGPQMETSLQIMPDLEWRVIVRQTDLRWCKNWKKQINVFEASAAPGRFARSRPLWPVPAAYGRSRPLVAGSGAPLSTPLLSFEI